MLQHFSMLTDKTMTTRIIVWLICVLGQCICVLGQCISDLRDKKSASYHCLWIDYFLFTLCTDIICDWICKKVPFSHIKFLFVYVPWTYMCSRKFIHRGFVDYWKETIIIVRTFAWQIRQTFLWRQRIIRNTCMQIINS